MTDVVVQNPRRLTERIKAHLESLQRSLDELGELIAEAYEARVWEPLGYADWGTYVSAEFYSMSRLRLTRNERRELVVNLRSVGMSTRAIGTALGTDQSTVVRDLSRDADASPADSVTGLDGKEYEPTKSKAAEVQHSTTTTEKTVETPVVVDRDSGEVIESTQASQAVTEFLDSDVDVQRARYLHEFLKVRTRSDDFMQFDPEKLAGFADRELIELVDSYPVRVQEWTERFHKALSGLRVISGGRQ